jgi:hypothetical protein
MAPLKKRRPYASFLGKNNRSKAAVAMFLALNSDRYFSLSEILEYMPGFVSQEYIRDRMSFWVKKYYFLRRIRGDNVLPLKYEYTLGLKASNLLSVMKNQHPRKFKNLQATITGIIVEHWEKSESERFAAQVQSGYWKLKVQQSVAGLSQAANTNTDGEGFPHKGS